MNSAPIQIFFERQPIDSKSAVVKNLSTHLNLSPQVLENAFIKDDQGRPSFKNISSHFSVSHTREVLGIAISESGPIGFDIESKNRSFRSLEIAERFFHEDEASWLRGLSSEKLNPSFLKIWTAKEAIFKCDSRSFGKILKNINLTEYAVRWEAHQTYSLQQHNLDLSLLGFEEARWGLMAAVALKAPAPIKLQPFLPTKS